MSPVTLPEPTLSRLVVRFPSIGLTDGQFVDICNANPELRFERTAGGDIVVMAPSGGDSGHRNFTLAIRLGVWTERDGTGIGFDSSTGFKLPNGAIRSPDAAWVQNARWDRLTPDERRRFPPLCPDFVVEVMSPSNELSDAQAKMQEYLDNGAALGWLIDPSARRLYVYRPGMPVECIEGPSTVSGDPVLPGFVLDLADLL